MAAEQTFHFRGDQHTVNGLTAYKLLTTQGDDEQRLDLGPWLCGSPDPYGANSDVYIRHADGSEDLLGSAIAGTSLMNDPGGYANGTWNCPETSLVGTDAIKIVERVILYGVSGPATWITEQLGWTKLNAATWTFRRMTFLGGTYIPQPPYYIFYAGIRHGTSSYDTQLQDVDYISYLDIGIRLKTGNGTIKIGALSDLTGHPLRIRKGDTTYAIPLVPINDPSASAIRGYDGNNVMALPEID